MSIYCSDLTYEDGAFGDHSNVMSLQPFQWRSSGLWRRAVFTMRFGKAPNCSSIPSRLKAWPSDLSGQWLRQWPAV